MKSEDCDGLPTNDDARAALPHQQVLARDSPLLRVLHHGAPAGSEDVSPTQEAKEREHQLVRDMLARRKADPDS